MNVAALPRILRAILTSQGRCIVAHAVSLRFECKRNYLKVTRSRSTSVGMRESFTSSRNLRPTTYFAHLTFLSPFSRPFVGWRVDGLSGFQTAVMIDFLTDHCRRRLRSIRRVSSDTAVADSGLITKPTTPLFPLPSFPLWMFSGTAAAAALSKIGNFAVGGSLASYQLLRHNWGDHAT